MSESDYTPKLIDLTKYKILDEHIIFNEKLGMNERVIIVKDKKQTPQNVLNYIHSYIEQNKDEVYQKNNERNKERYKNDYEYREKKLKQLSEYRTRKKLEKQQSKDN